MEGYRKLVNQVKDLVCRFEDVDTYKVKIGFDSSVPYTTPNPSVRGGYIIKLPPSSDADTRDVLSSIATLLHEIGHIAVKSFDYLDEYLKARPDLEREQVRSVANVIEDIVVDKYITIRGYSWRRIRTIFLLREVSEIAQSLKEKKEVFKQQRTIAELYLLLKTEILDVPSLANYPVISDFMSALENALGPLTHVLNRILMVARNGDRVKAFKMLSLLFYPPNPPEQPGQNAVQHRNSHQNTSSYDVDSNIEDSSDEADIDGDSSLDSDNSNESEDETEELGENSDEQKEQEQNGENEEGRENQADEQNAEIYNDTENTESDTEDVDEQESEQEDEEDIDQEDGEYEGGAGANEYNTDTSDMADVTLREEDIEKIIQSAQEVFGYAENEIEKQSKDISVILKGVGKGDVNLRKEFLDSPVQPILREWLQEYRRIKIMSIGWEDRKRAGELRLGATNVYSRFLRGRLDIFSKKVTVRKAKVGILVDISGSMYRGRKIDHAFSIAFLLQEFLKKSGNEVKAFIFNDNVTEVPRFRGVHRDVCSGGTAIAHAVVYAGSRVEFLFVITDALISSGDRDFIIKYFTRKKGLIGVIGDGNALPKWLAHGINNSQDFKTYLSRAEAMFQ